MAFQATVVSAVYQEDRYVVCVNFLDSTTSWKSSKTYLLSATAIKQDLIDLVTADGVIYKANLTKNNQIQTLIGQSITI